MLESYVTSATAGPWGLGCIDWTDVHDRREEYTWKRQGGGGVHGDSKGRIERSVLGLSAVKFRTIDIAGLQGFPRRVRLCRRVPM